MNIQKKVNEIKGAYLIRNPYIKSNKKNLPFNIIGYSFDDKFPVLVKTFEYKGTKRNEVNTKYTMESVLRIIEVD